MHLEKYENAVEDFTSALEINPNFSSAYLARAESLIYLEEFEAALNDCNAFTITEANSGVEDPDTCIAGRLEDGGYYFGFSGCKIHI